MVDELDIDLQVMVALDVRPEVREFSDESGDDDKPMFRRVRKRLGGLDASTMYGCAWWGARVRIRHTLLGSGSRWKGERTDECDMAVEFLSDFGLNEALADLGDPYLTAAADGRVIDKYVGVVPDLLLDVWRTVGFSGFAEGLLWLCDPTEWQSAVDDWIADLDLPFRDEWVPFTRTAFGTMTMWGKRTGKSLTIVPQEGFVIPVDRSDSMRDELGIILQILAQLVADIEMMDRRGDDDKPMFRRVRKRLGGLDASTMYGCVPAVGLGGSFTPKGMQIVNAVEHVRFLSTVTPRQVMNWKF